MLTKNKYLFCSLLSLISLVSCDQNRVFDQYANIDGDWNKNHALVFDYNVTDTVNTYNSFINMRITNDFPFHNIFLIVETHLPSKKITKDTLEYLMANPDGQLLGVGVTDVKESKLWFKEETKFTEIGDHTFKIYQAVRESGKVDGVMELKGVSEVGFRIEKSIENEQ